MTDTQTETTAQSIVTQFFAEIPAETLLSVLRNAATVGPDAVADELAEMLTARLPR